MYFFGSVIRMMSVTGVKGKGKRRARAIRVFGRRAKRFLHPCRRNAIHCKPLSNGSPLKGEKDLQACITIKTVAYPTAVSFPGLAGWVSGKAKWPFHRKE